MRADAHGPAGPSAGPRAEPCSLDGRTGAPDFDTAASKAAGRADAEGRASSRQTDQDPEVFFVAPLMLSGVRSSRPLVIAAARSADSSVIDSSISTSSSMAAR